MIHPALLLLWPALVVGPPNGVQTGPGAALERALASVNGNSIRADLEFLAGPELGGRGTPSPELEMAARFVEARVRRLGLEPGVQVGEESATYQHRFELRGQKFDARNSSFSMRGATGEIVLVHGDDLFLRGSVDLVDTELSATVISIGDGKAVTLRSVGSLEGSWALLVDGGRGTAGSIRRATAAGAAGVLVTPGDGYDRAPYGERYGKAMGRIAEMRYSSPMSSPPATADAKPVLLLNRTAATALLQAAQLDQLPAAGSPLEVVVTERRALVDRVASAPNVAALLPGHDPALADQLIVLCAHLDHLGTNSEGVVYPGADDNASGSVGLLALAEAIAARGSYGRSFLFLWVSGEESGLWGSAAWCRDLQLPGGVTPRAALNLDMIGRDAPATLWITPTAQHAAFNPFAALGAELAADEGFSNVVSQDSYWRASDHYSFASQLRIPVLYLSSGEHDDYHKPSDVPSLIDIDKLTRIVRLTLRILERSDALGLESVESVGGVRAK